MGRSSRARRRAPKLTIPLPWTTANYLTSTEVLLTPPSALAKRTKLSLADVDELLLELSSAVSAHTRTETQTVAELLDLEPGTEGRHEMETVDGELGGVLQASQGGDGLINDWITTGDEGLDALFGNGVRVGSITEITGQS